MVAVSDYDGKTPAWCPGCGDFGILSAVKNALVELDIEPHRIVMTSGIGQAGKLPHYTKANVFNSLHGRAVPPAIGVRIANQSLKVMVFGGDGDGYGEGANHFLTAARRNHDITYIVHNNQVYGLTKGQASPTSDFGFVTKTTPQGAGQPINPIALAIVSGATFVSRGFAGDVAHLTSIIKLAIMHEGFSLVDVLQPCVSFNHKNTYAWYRERVYDLGKDPVYDPGDKSNALMKAQEWGDRIPLGIIYQQQTPSYEAGLAALSGVPLVHQPIEPGRIEKLFAEFR